MRQTEGHVLSLRGERNQWLRRLRPRSGGTIPVPRKARALTISFWKSAMQFLYLQGSHGYRFCSPPKTTSTPSGQRSHLLQGEPTPFELICEADFHSILVKGVSGADMHRWRKIVLLAGISLVVAACSKGRAEFNEGRKAARGLVKSYGQRRPSVARTR
jgi:hypothetical protein